MKIIAISDTHNSHQHIHIPECDMLIHAGDMTTSGKVSEIENFLEWFSAQDAKYRVAIPGNHDFCTQKDPAPLVSAFRNQGCWLLVDEAVILDGFKIYGSPWQPWFNDWAWNFPREDKINGTVAGACWKQIPDDTQILITHGPPYGIRDEIARPRRGEDPHVGCPELLKRIKQLSNLKLHVFGHIHEQYGITQINQVKFVNSATNTLFMQPFNSPVAITI